MHFERGVSYMGGCSASSEGRASFAGIAAACGVAALRGAVLGIATWFLLSAAYWLIDIVWDPTPLLSQRPAFVFVLCVLGGFAIACWDGHFKTAPKSFSDVMAEVKRTGAYDGGPALAGIVSFLLPIVFGGSVGVAAGLVGVIAASCTRIQRRVLEVAHVARLVRPQRLLVNTTLAFFVVGACVLCTAFLGGGVPLPRFGAVELEGSLLMYSAVLALLGWMLLLLYLCSVRISKRVASLFRKRAWLKPVVCGVCLGAAGSLLPFVLFPGPVQVTEALVLRDSMAAALFIASGVAKVFFTAFCMNMSWVGGPFFPLIFAGCAVGLGVGAVLGIDAMLAAIVVSTALLASFSQRPLAAALVMMLIVPLQGFPYVLIAAFVGALLPLPGVSSKSEGFVRKALKRGRNQ